MRQAVAAVLVFLLIAMPAAAQQPGAYVETFDAGQPEQMLQGKLSLGTDGAWTGAVVDGAYQLTNAREEGALRYVFFDALAGAPGARLDQATLEAVVDARGESGLSGAGILVRLDPRARTYQLFVVGPMGYALIHRRANGVTVPLQGTHAAIRRDGLNTLTARPVADGIEYLVNGTRLFTYGVEGETGMSVGIGAVGRGVFRFERFAITPAVHSAPPVANPPIPSPPGPNPPPAGPPPPAAVQLQRQGEPGWFTIGVPAGWQLRTDRQKGHVAVQGAEGAVQVRPFLLPRPIDAATAQALLSAFVAELAPGTRWGAVHGAEAGGRPGLKVAGRQGDLVHVAAISAFPAPGGAAGMLWLVTSRAERFQQSAPLFGAVLESFRPAAGTAQSPAEQGGRGFVRWTDPVEGAFSTEVPQGWKVAGGTIRKAAVDVRHAIRVESPDGAIVCSVGDGEIPPFTEPTGTLREGSWYNPMAVQMMVRRYTPGEHFARWYTEWRLGQAGVQGLRFDAVTPLREATQAANAALARTAVAGIQVRADVGEARASGLLRGRPVRAYAFAATNRTGMADAGATWNVTAIIGFVAPEDRVGEAAAVLTHMLTSAEINPAWVGAQQRTTAETVRIVTETNRYVSNIISQSYADRSQRMDRVFERGSQARRGVVQLEDPATGQRYEVEAGSNYHWITDQGLIAGTNSHFNPNGLWFREMLRIEP
ncbi:MAG: hypothetical protein AB7P02_09560 [Alphaproteobacteria bacterium]